MEPVTIGEELLRGTAPPTPRREPADPLLGGHDTADGA
jgi:hypothetical protein